MNGWIDDLIDAWMNVYSQTDILSVIYKYSVYLII